MKNPRVPLLIVTGLAVLGLIVSMISTNTARASGESFTFTSTEDAYVNQTSASSNYGTNTALRVDNSPVLHSYVKFKVSGLNGAAVTSVKLRIYTNSSSSAGLTVSNTHSTWSEDNISYSNAPSIETELGKVSSVKGGTWNEVDVSSRVKGEGTFSFVLQTPGSTSINIASRETGDHAPQLVVTTNLAQTLPSVVEPTATGAASTQPITPPTAQPTTAPTQVTGGKDPIIFFQGDLVSGSSVSRAQKVVALIQNLISQNPGSPVLVASTGDNEQENSPTLANYQQYFDSTFGVFFKQGIFRQIRGNHDVQDAGHGAAYAQYFGSSANINFSYDFGGWHFVGIDQLNGSVNNTSLNFLKGDLATHQNTCQLVYWHVPTYSSGAAHGDSTGLKPLNQVLYDNGVDVQLSGHDHDYQRFYPLNPNGGRDDARGVTTFVDGIGGQDGRSGSQTSIAQAASAKYLDAFPGGEAIGTIMFTLHSTSADYKLYNANDGSVLDQGTVQCHTASGTVPTQPPAPTQPPSQPTATAVPTQPPSGDVQPSFPIRAAFYYPWFPEAWTQKGIYPYTNYTPSLGYYSDYDQATIQKHITAMQYGGIQAGISSWWGQGQHTDVKFSNLLSAAAGSSFRWAVYYENESQGDPSVAQINNDLVYLRDKYGKDPSYLRVNGKFVVFVYADTNDGCGMADRWKQANNVGAYVVLKVFPGYATCASQPDSWHQYAPAVATDSQGSYSYTISPGFWLKGNAVRLARDLTRWVSNVKAMAASPAKWQLVTTFNEWGEGTSVEAAQEWASASGYGQYLDALHNNGGAPVVPTPTSPAASTPTVQPTKPAVTATPTAQPTQPPATATPTAQPTATSTPQTGTTVLYFAGDNAWSGNGTISVSDALIKDNQGPIQLGGDTVWDKATAAEYASYWDPTYGRISKSRYHPAYGNHDANTPSQYASYWGSQAGANGQFYYSYDLNSQWHVIVLNSLGDTSATGTQVTWLKQDLAANANKCVIGVYHYPRWSSGNHGNNSSQQNFWGTLANSGADIVLNGHDHDYERFNPLDAGGNYDAYGTREFVVGTGGIPEYNTNNHNQNQAKMILNEFGYLKLTLGNGTYTWQFIPTAGGTVGDSGTGQCN